MAITRMALGGSGAAYGTFTDKTAAPANTTAVGSRYRYGYRYGWTGVLLLMWRLILWP